MSLRVLITNLGMISRSGTELYVRDLALELQRRGHTPLIYSPRLGPLADELRQAAIVVVDDLGLISEPPDVIHGQHALETMAALLNFPGVPGIFVCHDCSAWSDTPPRFPRLRRYVAVDLACRQRLTCQHGIAPHQVCVLQNAVDLRRFLPRPPLPERPQRALVISNYLQYADIRPLMTSCARIGLQLDSAGRHLAGVCDEPATILGRYDVVFAKGRCAWEALSIGNAVILCDAGGLGPMVSSPELEYLRAWNFGRRLLRPPLSVAGVAEQLARYDAGDAGKVAHRMRTTAATDQRVGQLIELYQEIIDEQSRDVSSVPADEHRAAANFVHWWSRQQHELIRHRARQYRLSCIVRRSWESLRRRTTNWLNAGE
jgi:hypothetical protein